MKHIKEHETEGEKFTGAYCRTIKHLVAPWTVGSSHLWVGVTIIHPGSSSNPHLHDDAEEVFYVLSGNGSIKVGDEEEKIGPGSCIFIPPKTVHQLKNTGDTELKALAATSPPFSPANFKSAHTPTKDESHSSPEGE
jgi:mannose-6-phosphate isomerase-like protein (cupin superfamily)